jgi:hypothetical protein
MDTLDRELCACCGADVGRAGSTAIVRSAAFAYCSTRCAEEHELQVAGGGLVCAELGCDADAVADTPYCDGHLDPAAGLAAAGGRHAA